jgi:tRNA(fMet)-specific endonuclease VapC
MKYLLDSNILIALGYDTNRVMVNRIAACDEGDLVTSSIVYAEVFHGSLRDKPPSPEKLASLTEAIPVLPFDEHAARAYAALPFKRASYDQLIAAHALSLGLTIVTHNEKHFADVPGLRVENWMI